MVINLKEIVTIIAIRVGNNDDGSISNDNKHHRNVDIDDNSEKTTT